MSLLHIFLIIFLLNNIYSIPTCIILDTDQEIHDEISNRSSLILRNLRSSNLILDTIPLSFIDLKDKPVVTCALETLNQLEVHMVNPFEFRRLRIEQPDHQTKFLDESSRETVPELSTAVYERRSDPEGPVYCRTCRDGLWSELSLCETVRCDAELLRANPRFVTEWGEIKSVDGGALYAPSSIFAVYAFSFGPHCKRCELNGQWSQYALAEYCSEIKFYGHLTTMKNFLWDTRKMKNMF